MHYRLWVQNEAKAEIRQLPGHMRQRILRAVQSLGDEPRPHDSRPLKAPEGIALEVRRLRVERWRVVYVIDEESAYIGVLAVRKRPPYDYRDLPQLLAG